MCCAQLLGLRCLAQALLPRSAWRNLPLPLAGNSNTLSRLTGFEEHWEPWSPGIEVLSGPTRSYSGSWKNHRRPATRSEFEHYILLLLWVSHLCSSSAFLEESLLLYNLQSFIIASSGEKNLPFLWGQRASTSGAFFWLNRSKFKETSYPPMYKKGKGGWSRRPSGACADKMSHQGKPY